MKIGTKSRKMRDKLQSRSGGKNRPTKHKIASEVITSSYKSKFLRGNYLIYLILFLSLVGSILLFDPKLDTGGDNANYILLGKALITGKGYYNFYHPLNLPDTHFPPGFPLLIGGIMAIAGENFLVLQIFSLLFCIGAIYLFYLIQNNKRDNYLTPIFYLLLLLFAIHPLILENSHIILSEPPFIFFFLLTIYFFKQWEQRNKKIWFLLLALSAIFCYFLRTAGIAVIIGIIAYLLYSRKFKLSAIFLIITLAFILPWTIRNKIVSQGDGGEYITQFLSKNPYDAKSGYIGIPELATRVHENFKVYFLNVIPKFIFPLYEKIIPPYKAMNCGTIVLALIICAVILYGLIKDIIDNKKLTHFLLVFYIGIILIWPSVWSGDRFLFPLLPFIILYFFKGISKISYKYFAIPFIFIGISLFTSLQKTLPEIPKNINMLTSYIKGDKLAGYSPDWRNYYLASDWIKANTPSNAVVLCRKPSLFYLQGQRKCFCYPFTFKHEEILKSIKDSDYIIVDVLTATTPKYLIPVLVENRNLFDIVYATGEPRTFVLKVKR